MKLIPENDDEAKDLVFATGFADEFYSIYKDVFSDGPASMEAAQLQELGQLNAALALLLFKWLEPSKWEDFYANLEKTSKNVVDRFLAL